MITNEIIKNTDYRKWISELKQQIRRSQIKAAMSVNSQQILLYWNLGKQIVDKQENAKWGSGFIEQMSKDLHEAFPDMKGFSRNNLFRMKNFYLFYITANQFVAQPVPQISIAEIEQFTGSAQFSPNLSAIFWKGLPVKSGQARNDRIDETQKRIAGQARNDGIESHNDDPRHCKVKPVMTTFQTRRHCGRDPPSSAQASGWRIAGQARNDGIESRNDGQRRECTISRNN
jgi:hypothetical protein